MPWSGPALLFVRRSAEIGSLSIGSTDVKIAVRNGEARIVILARDAPQHLRNEISTLCGPNYISIYVVPSSVELGIAATINGGPIPICALVAPDQDDELQDLIRSWEVILRAIWSLHFYLSGYNP
ncbi:50S ribosomal protein L30e-like [Arabidopsis thaliana x Arabidopsis arenosa]|uniref:50S ribosomal protein L30e-like n=1 Tax=Arabidopsis thaliana x Arabidopsis arenosa TaxID=1240361 RepID=A0A8T1ZP20_9BRAS|nr:50S ribosomal protein L30e-like [Arabidopsis thaliana x Arabidopsis arenosa]